MSRAVVFQFNSQCIKQLVKMSIVTVKEHVINQLFYAVTQQAYNLNWMNVALIGNYSLTDGLIESDFSDIDNTDNHYNIENTTAVALTSENCDDVPLINLLQENGQDSLY